MAYVNVREWSVEQVTDWMKGLDSNITRYITPFLNNCVDGHQLLNLRVDDLEHFGVQLQGHQELILEAVELLRNFHFELDKENVQTLALRLVCAARGISRDLQLRDINAQQVPTQTMSDVHSLVAIVKPLVQWLDRRPFSVEREYNNLSTQILQYSYFMVHHTHRDTFAEKPLVSIIELCDKLIKIGNHIVQEVSDPLILQPATLDLANLKKKEQELGFYILASNTAVHQVAEIALGSPAQINSKIEVGDEIVQVNYQTIVGWQRKGVLRLLQLSSPDIVLTLKKRPRHTKMYGQIYMQPYRLPSKKRDNNSAYPHWNWNFDNVPSPRLFTLPPINVQLTANTNRISNKAPVITEVTDLEEELSESNSDSDDCTIVGDDGDTKVADAGTARQVGRLYPVKPRVLLQRRNTISGSTWSFARPTDLIAQFYQELKKQASSNNSSASNIRLERQKFKEDSIHIRDKSVSCSHVLESGRPTTVIGGMTVGPVDRKRNKTATLQRQLNCHGPINKNVRKDINNVPIKKNADITFESEVTAISVISLNNLNQDSGIDFIDEGEDCTDRSKMNSTRIKDAALGEVHVTSIIKKFEVQVKPPEIQPRLKNRSDLLLVEGDGVVETKPPEIPNKPKVYPRTLAKITSAKNRGHLDKAHSTPAYDPLCAVALSEEHVYNVEYPAKSIENEIIGNFGNISKSPNILDVPPKPPPRIIKPPAKLPDIEKTIDSPSNFLIEQSNNISLINETLNKLDNTSTPLAEHSNTNQCKSKPLLILHSSQLNYNHPDVVPVLAPSMATTSGDYDHFQFDPMTASSPITKQPLKLSNLTDKHKISSSTNNLVAMIYPMVKGKAKKKNSLLAKRRNVSVSDVSPGDVQGFLFQRLRHKQTQNIHWEKRWFVLNSYCLYGFKSKESAKADCYIHLSGFTVTIANEVKSRSNAFKVYHTGTVFYFSAENCESQSSWIDSITSATLSSDPSKRNNDQNFYSETDDDDGDDSSGESNAKMATEKSESGGRKFNSLKKFARKRSDGGSVTSGSTSLDRKWFFNKTIGGKSSIPVKTDQFRSYRKIGTSTTTGNFTSHIPNFAQAKQTLCLQNVSSPNLAAIEDQYLTTTLIKPTLRNANVHNSNPSLATSEHSNFSAGQAASSKSKNDSLDGFLTLKELMYRQQEERKLNPHFQAANVHNINLIRADVVYGELPIRQEDTVNKTTHHHVRTSSDCSINRSAILNEPPSADESSCFGKRSGGGSSFKRSSGKNGSPPKQSNLYKDMSYEMIYCPLQTGADVVQFAQNRKVQQAPAQVPSDGHQYTPLSCPLNNTTAVMTAEERFQLDMATITPPNSSPFHSSGSGGKGKLNKFFGNSSRQDSKRCKKQQTTTSPRSLFVITSRNLSTVQPTAAESMPSWCNSTKQTDLHCDLQHQMLQVQYPQDLGLRNAPPCAGDYPGLEYPPVFEPETYSLADPHSTSRKLLRKQEQRK